MNIDNIKTSIDKKAFHIAMLLLILLLGVLGFLVFNQSKLWEELCRGLFFTFFTTYLTAIFISWLNPKNKTNAEIEILHSQNQIKEKFSSMRHKTFKWWFSGNRGTYTRSKTLPLLGDLSQENNQPIQIKINVIDFSNNNLCEKFQNYKNSLNQGAINDLKIEILATMIAAFYYKNKYQLLDIVFSLRPFYSPERMDLSTNNVIITTEDKGDPVIRYSSSNFFYKVNMNKFMQNENQSKKIEISTKEEFRNIESIKIKLINDLLQENQINLVINEQELTAAKELIFKSKYV